MPEDEGMRVLIAPARFDGTLSAVQAAEAIAAGWRRHAPADDLDLAPMADGGPGFVDVVHAAVGGELLAVTVRGPYGEPVPATILVAGETAYVECGQACGRQLAAGGDPLDASSYGAGELLVAALDAGALRIVAGLGPAAILDGGAGVLAALGATADVPLDAGQRGLRGIGSIDLGAALARCGGIELVAAAEGDGPLTGLFGSVKTAGPALGLAEESLPGVDAELQAWAEATDRRLSLRPGAGTAGGVGFALLLLGGLVEPGLDVVARTIGLAARAARTDLVVTGEGSFDYASRAGTVPYTVAQIAETALRPCISVAGEVLVGAREMRALGIESAYSVVELVGRDRAFADAPEAVAELSARVARTWSRP